MTAAARRQGHSLRLRPRLVALARDLVGYGLVSLVALACDYGLLVWLVTAQGVHYQVASLVSFSSGMLVAYVLCLRFVFVSRGAGSRPAEAAGFFTVGFAGLALTQALLFLFVDHGGVPVASAKLPTTALVFLFNFVCRRGLVFAGSRHA